MWLAAVNLNAACRLATPFCFRVVKQKPQHALHVFQCSTELAFLGRIWDGRRRKVKNPLWIVVEGAPVPLLWFFNLMEKDQQRLWRNKLLVAARGSRCKSDLQRSGNSGCGNQYSLCYGFTVIEQVHSWVTPSKKRTTTLPHPDFWNTGINIFDGVLLRSTLQEPCWIGYCTWEWSLPIRYF